MQRIQVIDSHTGGEPTRAVISGGPEFGQGSMAERLRVFRDCFDDYRRAIVTEPRGSGVLVGAWLCEPIDPTCAAGVIFFDNVQFLGMCGHGAIGLITTLAHLGRITPGVHRIETPVGMVSATLHGDGAVSVRNIPAFRKAAGVRIDLEDGRSVTGDVAYGGNWFYIVKDHGLELVLGQVESLTEFTWRVRHTINAQGFPEVDHIVLLEPSPHSGIDARNFVLCPGKAYDRSPCGTGTSATLACLAADGLLPPATPWRVESIVGSIFEGEYELDERGIVPTIKGSAYITAESTLLLDDADPFKWGIA